MRNSGGRQGYTRRIALGGVFSALALVFLLAGGFIPIGTFAAPIFAGICLLPMAIEVGTKWALLSYAVVSILGLLMVPDQELMLFFVLLLGYYPMLQPTLNRIKNIVLRYAVKLVLFNAVIVAVYFILLFLLASPALIEEMAGMSRVLLAVLLVGGNGTFVLYDYMLGMLRIVYNARIRGRFFK